MIHKTRTFLHYLLPFFLIFITSLTTAKVVDNPKMTLVQSMHETSRIMCVKSLEDKHKIKIIMRMEVNPIGPGSNMLHIAGSVEVPKLKPGTGWTDIRYKYTSSKQNELILKAWLNGTELTYKPLRDMYSGRFELNVIKMYMKGRMELLDGECPLPSTNTESVKNQEEDKAEPEEPKPIPTLTRPPQATTKSPEVIEPVHIHPQPIPPVNPDPIPPVNPDPKPPVNPDPKPPVNPDPKPPVNPDPIPPVNPDPIPPVHSDPKPPVNSDPEPMTPVPTPQEPPKNVTGVPKSVLKASNTPQAKTQVPKLLSKDETPQDPKEEASTTKDSWVSSMGYVGPIPILSIVIVAVMASAVIVISGIIIWRRRVSDREDYKVKNNHDSLFTHNTTQPLMSQAVTVNNESEGTHSSQFNNIDAVANPIYRPKSANTPPNFYGP